MRKHIKKIRNFLTTINENPALKATIEAETGMPVPDLPCKRWHKNSENKCCLKKFCKCFATCVFVFVVSFFMAITSLEITSNILANWDADAAANGDDEGTSPVVALLLLLTVTLTQVTIFALAVKAGKCLCAYLSGESCDNSASTAPSAPPASPVIVHMTSPSVMSSNGLGQASSSRRFWGRASANLTRMFSNGRVHGDYTALNGEDETEMVTVVPAGSISPQQYVVMTAAPVTKVNMV